MPRNVPPVPSFTLSRLSPRYTSNDAALGPGCQERFAHVSSSKAPSAGVGFETPAHPLPARLSTKTNENKQITFLHMTILLHKELTGISHVHITEALLQASSLIIPQLHLNFNNIQAGSTCRAAKKHQKSQARASMTHFSQYFGTPPPLTSIPESGFRQFHTSSRPRRSCQKRLDMPVPTFFRVCPKITVLFQVQALIGFYKASR